MPESADKLQERAAKLQERAAKLQEREAKLQEREAKLQERDALLSAMGWPFASNLVRPSGLGVFFVAAFITPVAPSVPSNGASLEDLAFQAIGNREQPKPGEPKPGEPKPAEPDPAGSSMVTQASVAQSYKNSAEVKV